MVARFLNAPSAPPKLPWMPKIVDPQQNGADGFSFNDETITYPQLQRVDSTLAQLGTNYYLITFVTTAIENYRHALPLAAKLCEESENAIAIHLEGPWLNILAKGAHPGPLIREFNREEAEELLKLGRGHIALVTLAPEMPGAMDAIRFFLENGVAISFGHWRPSLEIYDQAMKVIDEVMGNNGRVGLTHVLSGYVKEGYGRESFGFLPEAFQDERMFPMFITDGRHQQRQTPVLLKDALNNQGKNHRVIITNDGAPVLGCPPRPESYSLFNNATRVNVYAHDDPSSKAYVHPNDSYPNVSDFCGSPVPTTGCIEYAASIADLDANRQVDRQSLARMAALNTLRLLEEPLTRLGRFKSLRKEAMDHIKIGLS